MLVAQRYMGITHTCGDPTTVMATKVYSSSLSKSPLHSGFRAISLLHHFPFINNLSDKMTPLTRFVFAEKQRNALPITRNLSSTKSLYQYVRWAHMFPEWCETLGNRLPCYQHHYERPTKSLATRDVSDSTELPSEHKPCHQLFIDVLLKRSIQELTILMKKRRALGSKTLQYTQLVKPYYHTAKGPSQEEPINMTMN